MANFSVKVEPLEVPETVTVVVGNERIEVAITELDESTIGELVEEFVAALMTKVGK